MSWAFNTGSMDHFWSDFRIIFCSAAFSKTEMINIVLLRMTDRQHLHIILSTPRIQIPLWIPCSGLFCGSFMIFPFSFAFIPVEKTKKENNLKMTFSAEKSEHCWCNYLLPRQNRGFGERLSREAYPGWYWNYLPFTGGSAASHIGNTFMSILGKWRCRNQIKTN